MTFRVFFIRESGLCFWCGLCRLFDFLRRLGLTIEQTQRPADHAYGVKHERANQVGQGIVAFGAGDDRPHNPDHSDNTDDPQ